MKMSVLFAVAFLVLSLSLACADPLGTEREAIIRDLAVLQEDCDNLSLIAYRVEEVDRIIDEVRGRSSSYVDQLRTMDGCGPCAEKLSSAMASARTCSLQGAKPSAPSFGNRPSKWDPLAELQQRHQAWEDHKAALLARCETKIGCELALESVTLSLRVLVGDQPDPSCAACQAHVEMTPLFPE